MPGSNAAPWGMIIFTILEDGNLQGLWTDCRKAGDDRGDRRRLFMEIARKVEQGVPNQTPAVRAELIGDYHVAWIDEPNDNAIIRKLKIVRNGPIYSLQWLNDNGQIGFTGVGLRIGHDKLSVTYWPGDAPRPEITAQI